MEDMTYAEKRYKLIPKAKKIAQQRVIEYCNANKGKVLFTRPGEPYIRKPGAGRRAADGKEQNYRHDLFTEFFHEEMNRLAKEEGLVK